MYWTLELASKLEDAPWPATKDELIDYAMRSGAPLEVIEMCIRDRFRSIQRIFMFLFLVYSVGKDNSFSVNVRW